MASFDTLAKWVGILSSIWVVVSSVLNWIFWFRSPDAWVAFAEAKPRGAAFIRVVRSYGVDPRKGLIALRDLAARNPRAHRPPSERPPAVPMTEAAALPGAVYLDPQTDRVERKDIE